MIDSPMHVNFSLCSGNTYIAKYDSSAAKLGQKTLTEAILKQSPSNEGLPLKFIEVVSLSDSLWQETTSIQGKNSTTVAKTNNENFLKPRTMVRTETSSPFVLCSLCNVVN